MFSYWDSNVQLFLGEFVLQNGRYGDTRILEESTAQQMHRETLFTHDPRIQGNLHGFLDVTDIGQFTIAHYGGADPQFGGMLLLPDQNLGVYFVTNSQGGQKLIVYHLGFAQDFFNHYYPTEYAPIEPPADFAERVGWFTGNYRYVQTSYTTPEKIMQFFMPMTISDPGDGTLLFSNPFGEFRFVEVEPLYFRDVDGELALVFREDDQGRITHMFWSLIPCNSFEKMSWYETAGFNMVLALGCILVFLTLLIVALIGFIRDRRRGSDLEPASRGAHIVSRMNRRFNQQCFLRKNSFSIDLRTITNSLEKPGCFR
jgi:hypothetical protein